MYRVVHHKDDKDQVKMVSILYICSVKYGTIEDQTTQ